MKTPIVAKNKITNSKSPHFSHHTLTNCKGGDESAIHKYAKQLICERKELFIPDFEKRGKDYHIKLWSEKYKSEAEKIIFDYTIAEKYYKVDENHAVKPDVVCIKNGNELFIEFAKTHFVDEIKRIKIKELNKPCIEINLSAIIENCLDATKIKSDIENVLFNDNSFNFYRKKNENLVPYKYWINNQKQERKALKEFDKKLEEITLKEKNQEQILILKKELEEEKRLVRKKVEQEKILKEEEHRLEKRKEKDEKTLIFCKERNCNIYPISYENTSKTVGKECKLRIELLNEMKHTFSVFELTNPVLKKIFEGKYWDGKIHFGESFDEKYLSKRKQWFFMDDDREKWIFVENEKILVYPSEGEINHNKRYNIKGLNIAH